MDEASQNRVTQRPLAGAYAAARELVDKFPVRVTTPARARRRERNAFEIGVDAGRAGLRTSLSCGAGAVR
jgi:hypothetical protein